MDSVRLNHNGDCIDDKSPEQSLNSESADSRNVFGDPVLLPRVGDQYQVEVPSPITESDYLCLTQSPTDAEIMVGSTQDFLIGLPISVMWIIVENIKHEALESDGDLVDVSDKNEAAKSACINSDELKPKFVHMDIASDNVIKLRESELKPKIDPMDIASDSGIKLREPEILASQRELKIKMHQKHGGEGCALVPGSLGSSWSDLEEASFLLGLYIFGKDLVRVKRFVESKKMGDILSHYYGKFYRSDKYNRWSKCRKVRRRKRSKIGQNIFTGLRQQELVSRLLPVVSEDFHGTLLEISKAFGDGTVSLEEYVITLKATAGLNNLVDAVGIGKGKQDLTRIAMEPLRSNQAASVLPEIPIGKELTTVEIINFLTGDFRLSKARSSDLFWEAVWPRLLARGWHSEQPNNHGCAIGYKHSLVFLIPGIKKFSRRKLVKGNHYFDSVSDVLSKVASEPGLLELEIEAGEGQRKKEECGWTNGTDQKDLPDQQRRSYLKPQTPNLDADAMKFTVVDTSWANRQTFKVRELRSLPGDVMKASTSRSHSEKSDGNSFEESMDESDSADASCFDEGVTNISKQKIILDRGVSFERVDCETYDLKQEFRTNDPEYSNESEKISNHQNTGLCNESHDRQTRRGMKCQLSWSVKPDNKYHLAPFTKRRRRLTACNRSQTSQGTNDFLVYHRLKQGDASCCSDNPDFSESTLSQGNPSRERLSFMSSSKCNPIKTSEGVLSTASIGVQHHCENQKPQPRMLIDLNLPIPPDGETDEPMMIESAERQHAPTRTQPDDPNAQKTSSVNSRRQSTRNRPLTTKALEALAHGFVSTKRRQKSSNAEISILRPSRLSRGKMRVTENFDASNMDFNLQERGNSICKSNSDMLSEVQV